MRYPGVDLSPENLSLQRLVLGDALFGGVFADVFGSPLAQSFVAELELQLTKLLAENKIALGFPVQSRIKAWESLREKIERRSLKLKSVTDLHDLIGFRITVLFRRSLEETTTLLDKHFKVISKEDTASRLTENEFGYPAQHLL